MKRLQFTYTKENNDVSKRDLVVISQPSNKYFGIDISELDDNQKMWFITNLKELRDEYDESFKSLLDEFNLSNRYRQFFQTKMSNVNGSEV